MFDPFSSLVLGSVAFVSTASIAMIAAARWARSRPHRQLARSEGRRRNAALNVLAKRLEWDRDPRTEKCLEQLRILHAQLLEAVNDNVEPSLVTDLIERVDGVFVHCVQQLVESMQLYEKSLTALGPAKEALLIGRTELIRGAMSNMFHLGHALGIIQGMSGKRTQQLMHQLRDELDTTLEIAQRVDQRMWEIEKNVLSELSDIR